MRSIICTARTGYSPTAVSADNMTASVPSRTAVATSVTSALVGRGECVIDSSISVAVIDTLALALVRARMSFCADGTLSIDSSTPRSPRATMAPCASVRMSSRFAYPTALSILAITGVAGARRRIWRMSAADETNEAAIRSTPSHSPNLRSSSSLGVMAGTLSSVPGNATPL